MLVDPYTADGAGFCPKFIGELLLFDGVLPLSTTPAQCGWLTPTSGDPIMTKRDRLLGFQMRNVSGRLLGWFARAAKDQPPLLPVETNWCAFAIIEWPIDNSPAFTQQTDTGTQPAA